MKKQYIIAIASTLILGGLSACEPQPAGDFPDWESGGIFTDEQSHMTFIEPRVDRKEWWNCDEAQCQMTAQEAQIGSFLLIDERDDLAYLDGGSPMDGPAVMIQKSTGQILAWCGGALMVSTQEDREKCKFEYWEGRI